MAETFPGENAGFYGGYDDEGYPHTPSAAHQIPLAPQETPGAEGYANFNPSPADPHRAAYDELVDRYFGTQYGITGTGDGNLGHASQETGV